MKDNLNFLVYFAHATMKINFDMIYQLDNIVQYLSLNCKVLYELTLHNRPI